ncbi:hypothetical protein M9Y10_019494 [Tritrichomonas musculus]|uniref:DUF3447 domain-containing protein n=1 Tax=Tritrichomonas musculus TaxID=1915356 RepID=A0ABR2HGG2_9EUKA
MKEIQEKFLEFLNDEVNCDDIITFFDDQKIFNDTNLFKSFLHMIVKISNGFHRSNGLIAKMEQIIQFFKEKIEQNFTNNEIFEIFKSNKRILLILIENKLLTIDKSITLFISEGKYLDAFYPHYFFPEVKPFLSKSLTEEILKEIPDNFDKKRQIGENDNYICQLIQNDSIDEFVSYVNQTNISLSIEIEPSIFETNPFLIKYTSTLIEYAAFYGSIQIFQYLRLNKVNLEKFHFDLTPSLWFYSIHGNNADIIHILEENHIRPLHDSYQDCFAESIKCHHNGIANYFITNYLSEKRENNFEIFITSIKYYNFAFVVVDHVRSSLFYLCRYDYFHIVKMILDENIIDVNYKLRILKKIIMNTV